MLRCLIMMLAFFCLAGRAYCNSYVGVSIEGLLSHASSESVIPLGNVLGVVVDNDGDWIVIGAQSQKNSMGRDELLIAAASSVRNDLHIGVLAHADYVPGSDKIRLTYTSGLTNTEAGRYLGRAIMRFNLVADGKDELPLHFRHYPLAERPTLRFNSDSSGCMRSAKSNAFVWGTSSIKISPVDVKNGKDELPVGFTDWMRQLNERFFELEELHAEFFHMRNFLRLSTMFIQAYDKKRLDRLTHKLAKFRPKRTTTPSVLSYPFARSVTHGMRTPNRKKKLSCTLDDRVTKLRDSVLAAKRSTADKTSFFQFEAPLLASLQKNAVSTLMQDSKALGLHRRSLVLDLTMGVFPPELKVFYDNHFYSLPTDAAWALRGLIKLSETQTIGDKNASKMEHVSEQWQEFRQLYLDELLDSLDKGDAVLVLISDEVNEQWVKLDRMMPIAKGLQVYIAAKSRDGFVTTVQRFYKHYGKIPQVTKDNVAMLVTTQDTGVIEKLGDLTKIIGASRVLINPTPDQLRTLIQQRDFNVLLMDVGFGDESILLNDGETTVSDVLHWGRMDHVRFIAQGIFGLHGNNAIDGLLLKAMQSVGAGVAVLGRDTKGAVAQRIDRLLIELSLASTDPLPAQKLAHTMMGDKLIFIEKLP